MNFLKKQRQFIVVSIFILALGGLSALLSGGFDYYKLMEKPPLAPPSWIFPIAWSILYIMMGIAAVFVSRSNDLDKTSALRIFIIQLIVNLVWPIIFFRFEAPKIALFWLLLLILLVLYTVKKFFLIDKKAGWLLVPYLAWTFFAFYLNFGIVALNS